MVEEYIPSTDHFVGMVIETRAVYHDYLRQSGIAKLKSVSKEGTLKGCLTEVRRKGGWVLVYLHTYTYSTVLINISCSNRKHL